MRLTLLSALVVSAALVFGTAAITPVHAMVHPAKSAGSYAKDACKEWAKVPRLPTTQAELTKWLQSASKATKNAVGKASSAAKRDKAWNTLLGHFLMLQEELQYVSAYRAFSNARQWDTSVMYLKVTCSKLLAK